MACFFFDELKSLKEKKAYSSSINLNSLRKYVNIP